MDKHVYLIFKDADEENLEFINAFKTPNDAHASLIKHFDVVRKITNLKFNVETPQITNYFNDGERSFRVDVNCDLGRHVHHDYVYYIRCVNLYGE